MPRKQKALEYLNVEAGTAHANYGNQFHARVFHGKSIEIYGVYGNHCRGPQQFRKVFRVGDWAQHGRWQLRYLGLVTKVGKRRIVVSQHQDDHWMPLAEFIAQNWDFDLEKSREENRRELQSL